MNPVQLTSLIVTMASAAIAAGGAVQAAVSPSLSGQPAGQAAASARHHEFSLAAAV
jgi:hypothetical protein